MAVAWYDGRSGFDWWKDGRAPFQLDTMKQRGSRYFREKTRVSTRFDAPPGQIDGPNAYHPANSILNFSKGRVNVYSYTSLVCLSADDARLRNIRNTCETESESSHTTYMPHVGMGLIGGKTDKRRSGLDTMKPRGPTTPLRPSLNAGV